MVFNQFSIRFIFQLGLKANWKQHCASNLCLFLNSVLSYHSLLRMELVNFFYIKNSISQTNIPKVVKSNFGIFLNQTVLSFEFFQALRELKKWRMFLIWLGKAILLSQFFSWILLMEKSEVFNNFWILKLIIHFWKFIDLIFSSQKKKDIDSKRRLKNFS